MIHTSESAPASARSDTCRCHRLDARGGRARSAYAGGDVNLTLKRRRSPRLKAGLAASGANVTTASIEDNQSIVDRVNALSPTILVVSRHGSRFFGEQSLRGRAGAKCSSVRRSLAADCSSGM
jgi:hypothetical protein